MSYLNNSANGIQPHRRVQSATHRRPQSASRPKFVGVYANVQPAPPSRQKSKSLLNKSVRMTPEVNKQNRATWSGGRRLTE